MIPTTGGDSSANQSPEAAGQAPGPPSGAAVYSRSGCAACHGPQLSGSALGPTLLQADEHWQRGALAAFVKDPAPAEKASERLRSLRSSFPSPMRGYPVISKADREALADYILAQAQKR